MTITVYNGTIVSASNEIQHDVSGSIKSSPVVGYTQNGLTIITDAGVSGEVKTTSRNVEKGLLQIDGGREIPYEFYSDSLFRTGQLASIAFMNGKVIYAMNHTNKLLWDQVYDLSGKDFFVITLGFLRLLFWIGILVGGYLTVVYGGTGEYLGLIAALALLIPSVAAERFFAKWQKSNRKKKYDDAIGVISRSIGKYGQNESK